jgi:catalase
VLAGDGVDGSGIDKLRRSLQAKKANVYVIAPRGGSLTASGDPVNVDRTVITTQSVEYDALVVAGGTSADVLAADPYAAVNIGEAFRHCKTIAAWGEGRTVLEKLSMTDAVGVVTSAKCDAGFISDLIEAIGWHRHWDRVPAS